MSTIKKLVKNLNDSGKKFSEANNAVMKQLDEIQKKLPAHKLLSEMTDYEMEEIKGLFEEEKELVQGVYAWVNYIEKNLENVAKIYFMLGSVTARHNSFELFYESKKNAKK